MCIYVLHTIRNVNEIMEVFYIGLCQRAGRYSVVSVLVALWLQVWSLTILASDSMEKVKLGIHILMGLGL